MSALFVYILWILFAIYEGQREALYFSYKMKATLQIQRSLKRDEHVMFTIQRSVVAAIASIASYTTLFDCALFIISMAFSFPFFHDGMYYVTRERLDGIYKKGWFDQSTTSTAKSDKFNFFNPVSRTALFGISILIIAYEIIMKLK